MPVISLMVHPSLSSSSSSSSSSSYHIDPRDFEADSIRCVADVENKSVTLVLGKRRKRYNALQDPFVPSTIQLTTTSSITNSEIDKEVVAVLFDRHTFGNEEEAKRWWLMNKSRLMPNN